MSLTIGLPFCIFKLLFGLAAMDAGSRGDPLLSGFGLIVTVWAGMDLAMNIGRIGFDLANRPAGFEYCTIAEMGRLFKRPMVFLALDTFLTFLIISAMLWSGWITRMTPAELILWYSATTLNLVSLSLVSLYNEVRAVRNDHEG